MEERMTKETKRLVHQARMVGCDLFATEKVTLVTYTAHGEVKEKYCYDYDDANCVDRIRSLLAEIALPLRRKWGPNFLELAPVAFTFGYTVKVGNFSAILTKPANPSDEGSQEEIRLLECPLSSAGLHRMSDYLANILLDDQSAADNSEEEKEETIMKIELSPELAKVITIMYYRMSAKEQQDLLDNADPEVVDIIMQALRESLPSKSKN